MSHEKKLVAALQTPKEQQLAFSELLRQYKQPLYWHIRRMVVRHEDADDVLQNTFIKVFRNIKKFKGDSKLYTWLYRIATNEAMTHLNKKAKQGQCTVNDVKEQALKNLKSDPYFEGGTAEQILLKAIAALPQKQQLVFTMKYFEDHTYQQLSEILETSVGALKSSYHIATAKITAYVKEHGSNPLTVVR
ncbi:MAG: RNA polymerase sigma factor [Marinirhabdus sp.]